MSAINLDNAKTHCKNGIICLQKGTNNSITSLQEQLKILEAKKERLPTGIARGNTEVKIINTQEQINKQRFEMAVTASITAFNSNNTGPNGYKLPINPSSIDVNYWNSLSKEEQKYLHYNRNVYQSGTDIPKTKSSINLEEWTSKKEAIAHNLKGATGNEDFRGKGIRAHQQAIYDKNENLVSTPENIGTYDFVAPGLFNFKGHLIVDVKPWIEWGNAPYPDDTTTKQERIDALRSTFFGRMGANHIGFRGDGLTSQEREWAALFKGVQSSEHLPSFEDNK